MCLADIGQVVARDADEALVRTARGRLRVSLLLAPDVAVGEHVTMHSGHVIRVLTPEEVAEAVDLRAGPGNATPPRAARTEG